MPSISRIVPTATDFPPVSESKVVSVSSSSSFEVETVSSTADLTVADLVVSVTGSSVSTTDTGSTVAGTVGVVFEETGSTVAGSTVSVTGLTTAESDMPKSSPKVL